jgi:hypothetical protein
MTIRLGQVPLLGVRRALGAEELIELGRRPPLGQARSLPGVQPAGGGGGGPPSGRTVVVSADEAKLLNLVTEGIVSFANDYPIEFHSYCPTDRWQKALELVGTWSHEMESQVAAGASQIQVPADVIFRLVDLEKCVSAARDARLSGAKTAFTLSAIGAIADFIFGITWLGVPAYVAGLAILLGRPLLAKYSANPQEPYKPELAGRPRLLGIGGDDCPKQDSLGDHTDKAKILERVLVAAVGTVQKFHWGEATPGFAPPETGVCLAKDRWRVRVEGWANDRIRPGEGWTVVPLSACEARKEICVWCPNAGSPRDTPWGDPPRDSGFENTYWVEYVGPKTGGFVRRAGPFG